MSMSQAAPRDARWGPGEPPEGGAEPLPSHSEALIDFAVQHSPIIYYIASLEGRRPVRFISANVERLTGHPAAAFTADETFGRRHVHPDDLARYHAAVGALPGAGHGRVEYRFRDAAGEWRWVREELRLLPAAQAGERCFVGCMTDITAERVAEVERTEAAAMLRTLVENALDAVIAMDDEGLVVEFNPAAERMFAYSRAEALGRPLGDLIVPPEHRQRHASGLARYRAQDSDAGPLESRRLQVTAQRRDGSTFPVELTIARTQVGDKGLFFGEVRDLSERAAAQAEQARLVRLVEDAVASLPAAFCMTDRNDHVLLCNKVFADAYGMTPEQIIGRSRREMLELMLPRLVRFDGRAIDPATADRDAIIQRLGDAEHEPIEVETKKGYHQLIWSRRTADGNVINVRTDITPIKRAEQAVRQSHEMVHRVLDACPMPVGMTRAETSEVLYESPAAKALYGRTESEAPVFARSNFVDPTDRDRYLAILRSEGRIDGFEVRMRRFDGQEFWAALSARLVEFRGEEVIVSSTFDLTEWRAVEEQMARQREALHQSEKLAALGELLAGVAHELNNPLSVVVGQALLLGKTTSDPRIAERAEKIGKAADRCARIVKAFLSMARQQPRQSQALDLNQLVDGALEVTAYTLRSSDVEVALRLAPALPAVWGDPDQLTQVLTNLIINAEQALRDRRGGRKVTITTGYRRARGEVYIKVKDNGPGVPADLRRRIFEPFFTTKQVGSGTGIGLAFCHRVLEAHGGRIKLECPPDGGTVFQVVLQAGVADTETVAPPEPAAAPRVGRAALVIDDESDVAEVIAEILEAEGLEVVVAVSGSAALKRLKERRFDVVLSDLKMPGLDGPRLYELIAASQPAMAARIGFVTGDAMSPRMRRFLEESGRPFVEKPVTPEEVQRLLADLADDSVAATTA